MPCNWASWRILEPHARFLWQQSWDRSASPDPFPADQALTALAAFSILCGSACGPAVDLKRDLQGRGHTFVTETDTEIVAHLVERPPAALGDDDAFKEGVDPALGHVHEQAVHPVPHQIAHARHRCRHHRAGEGHRLGHRDPDQERPHQPRPDRHGHRLDDFSDHGACPSACRAACRRAGPAAGTAARPSGSGRTRPLSGPGSPACTSPGAAAGRTGPRCRTAPR